MKGGRPGRTAGPFEVNISVSPYWFVAMAAGRNWYGGRGGEKRTAIHKITAIVTHKPTGEVTTYPTNRRWSEVVTLGSKMMEYYRVKGGKLGGHPGAQGEITSKTLQPIVVDGLETRSRTDMLDPKAAEGGGKVPPAQLSATPWPPCWSAGGAQSKSWWRESRAPSRLRVPLATDPPRTLELPRDRGHNVFGVRPKIDGSEYAGGELPKPAWDALIMKRGLPRGLSGVKFEPYMDTQKDDATECEQKQREYLQDTGELWAPVRQAKLRAEIRALKGQAPRRQQGGEKLRELKSQLAELTRQAARGAALTDQQKKIITHECLTNRVRLMARFFDMVEVVAQEFLNYTPVSINLFKKFDENFEEEDRLNTKAYFFRSESGAAADARWGPRLLPSPSYLNHVARSARGADEPLKPDVVERLERSYELEQKPTTEELKMLAEASHVKVGDVEDWFIRRNTKLERRGADLLHDFFQDPSYKSLEDAEADAEAEQALQREAPGSEVMELGDMS